MNHILRVGSVIIALFPAVSLQSVRAAEWSVPVGGNTFRTAPSPSSKGLRRDGTLNWSDQNSVYSIFFHVDRPTELMLGVNAASPVGQATLRAEVGNNKFKIVVDGPNPRSYTLGAVKVDAGYVRLDLQGINRTGESFAEIREIEVSSPTEHLKIDYVKSNKGNMFYWGRRGPSVHLRYEVPKAREIQYAYSEITVPQGEDPIGSYFMANGFGEGYFGIQVNSPKERRVLFSVWSPFKTDKPSEIPQDQRIIALERGRDVHIGEFGNEGSGGQSYLAYPWKAGRAYRFLTEVKPDGNGSTIYASWFGDKAADEWRLIARFRRPQTDTHLRGFHSFLESFSPSFGHIGRRAFYGNVWVCDVHGEWHECTRARLSVDATGRGRHRLDFDGGSVGTRFFMRNCGFFNESGQPGKIFSRESTTNMRPEIDFAALKNS